MTAPWAATPPEDNDALLRVGAFGAGTTIEAGIAWQAQTLESLTEAGTSQGNSMGTSAAFVGIAGTASEASLTRLNADLTILAEWAQTRVPALATAVEAYQQALSTMFKAEICLENRAEQAHCVGINPLVFFTLTPNIVRLDATYFGPMWTTNASAGMAYAAILMGLITGVLGVVCPIDPAPSVSPDAPAHAAAAVADATATGAAGDAMRASQQAATTATGQVSQGANSPMSAMQSFMEPVQSMAQIPSSLSQSAMSPLQSALSPMQSFMGMFSSLGQGGAMGGAGGGIPAGAAQAVSASAPGASAGSTAGGSVGGGSGYAGSALTSYTRPTNSFSPESSAGGSAAYAKPTAARGAAGTTPMTTGGAMAPMGMMRQGEKSDRKNEPKTARLSA